MRMNHFVASVGVVLVVGASSVLLAPEEGQKQDSQALLRWAKLVSQRALPLGKDDRLRVAAEVKGEWKNVPVALVAMSYRLEVVQVDRNGRTRRRPGWWIECYQLRSKGGTPYAWSMWSYRSLGHFRLLADRNHNNVLAWVEFNDVFFTTISEPRDQVEELTQKLSGEPRPPAPLAPGVERVPVGLLVPGVAWWGENALFSDISILSIDQDDHGNMTVKISGPDSKRVYTLVRHEGRWKRQ